MAKAPRTLPFAAADVVAEVIRWRAFLAGERRMSPKTVEAYAPRRRQFLAFLAEHLGGKVTIARLSNSRRPMCAPSWRRAAPTVSAAGR